MFLQADLLTSRVICVMDEHSECVFFNGFQVGKESMHICRIQSEICWLQNPAEEQAGGCV